MTAAIAYNPEFDSEEAQNEYLQRCLNIAAEDLDGEFTRLPAAVAYWAGRHAEAVKLEQEAELAYDQERGQAYKRLGDKKSDSGKPLTVDAIKAALECDDELVALKQDAINATAERMRLKGIVDAVMAKRDMLQSLGAQKRAERSFTMRDRDWEQ